MAKVNLDICENCGVESELWHNDAFGYAVCADCDAEMTAQAEREAAHVAEEGCDNCGTATELYWNDEFGGSVCEDCDSKFSAHELAEMDSDPVITEFLADPAFTYGALTTHTMVMVAEPVLNLFEGRRFAQFRMGVDQVIGTLVR